MPVVASWGIMFFGSFYLSPGWAMGKRIVFSALLPAGVELAVLVTFLWFIWKLWSTDRRVQRG